MTVSISIIFVKIYVSFTGAAPPSHKIPDPCAGEPCKNGGSCVPKANKFQCLCSMGFEGPTCEVTGLYKCVFFILIYYRCAKSLRSLRQFLSGKVDKVSFKLTRRDF